MFLPNLVTYIYLFCPPRSDEVQLVKHLLGAYKQRGIEPRPLRNSTNGIKVTVYFGMRLIHMDLDEANQRMHTSAWLRIVCIFIVLSFINSVQFMWLQILYIFITNAILIVYFCFLPLSYILPLLNQLTWNKQLRGPERFLEHNRIQLLSTTVSQRQMIMLLEIHESKQNLKYMLLWW